MPPLDGCAGREFRARRDRAIILLFVDGRLRLAELAGLGVEDVDVRDRMVYVVGKGSGRRGPRKRAVPLGIKAAHALDRYLRERRRHPWATHEALWLGDRGRGPVSAAGIEAMLDRYGKSAAAERARDAARRYSFGGSAVVPRMNRGVAQHLPAASRTRTSHQSRRRPTITHL